MNEHFERLAAGLAQLVTLNNIHNCSMLATTTNTAVTNGNNNGWVPNFII